MSPGPSWITEEWLGGAGLLHGRPLRPDDRRRVVWLTPRRPAVVLGSTTPGQPGALAWRGATVDVVRRRSGGGLVWVDPLASMWVDLEIPVGDPLHRVDVSAAFEWVGEMFARALGRLGVDAEVHRGPHVPGADRGLVCFAGRGAGEVFVAGRKIVGISQRRTRSATRFQCVAYDHFELGPLALVVDARVADRAATAGIGVSEVGVSGGLVALRSAVSDELAVT